MMGFMWSRLEWYHCWRIQQNGSGAETEQAHGNHWYAITVLMWNLGSKSVVWVGHMIDSMIYTGRETVVLKKELWWLRCLAGHCAEPGWTCGYQESKVQKTARNTWIGLCQSWSFYVRRCAPELGHLCNSYEPTFKWEINYFTVPLEHQLCRKQSESY